MRLAPSQCAPRVVMLKLPVRVMFLYLRDEQSTRGEWGWGWCSIWKVCLLAYPTLLFSRSFNYGVGCKQNDSVIAHGVYILTWSAANLVMHGSRERKGGMRSAFWVMDAT
jgi:hypothetical protein